SARTGAVARHVSPRRVPAVVAIASAFPGHDTRRGARPARRPAPRRRGREERPRGAARIVA
ncbi:MAG TPA: hypothetical protein PKG80_01655, partial [Acidobacteriota bacterium]|nr:hypothetical protein [Acidobacteriota bacterium]